MNKKVQGQHKFFLFSFLPFLSVKRAPMSLSTPPPLRVGVWMSTKKYSDMMERNVFSPPQAVGARQVVYQRVQDVIKQQFGVDVSGIGNPSTTKTASSVAARAAAEITDSKTDAAAGAAAENTVDRDKNVNAVVVATSVETLPSFAGLPFDVILHKDSEAMAGALFFNDSASRDKVALLQHIVKSNPRIVMLDQPERVAWGRVGGASDGLQMVEDLEAAHGGTKPQRELVRESERAHLERE